MKLTKEEGQDLVDDCLEGWEAIEETIAETSRWSIHYNGVFKHIDSGKFYSTYWSVGATESQDEGPFEYDDPELWEVEKKEVTVVKYVKVIKRK